MPITSLSLHVLCLSFPFSGEHFYPNPACRKRKRTLKGYCLHCIVIGEVYRLYLGRDHSVRKTSFSFWFTRQMFQPSWTSKRTIFLPLLTYTLQTFVSLKTRFFNTCFSLFKEPFLYWLARSTAVFKHDLKCPRVFKKSTSFIIQTSNEKSRTFTTVYRANTWRIAVQLQLMTWAVRCEVLKFL